MPASNLTLQKNERKIPRKKAPCTDRTEFGYESAERIYFWSLSNCRGAEITPAWIDTRLDLRLHPLRKGLEGCRPAGASSHGATRRGRAPESPVFGVAENAPKFFVLHKSSIPLQ
jgi:hypothetical protein